jgi:hypothetical protein
MSQSVSPARMRTHAILNLALQFSRSCNDYPAAVPSWRVTSALGLKLSSGSVRARSVPPSTADVPEFISNAKNRKQEKGAGAIAAPAPFKSPTSIGMESTSAKTSKLKGTRGSK